VTNKVQNLTYFIRFHNMWPRAYLCYIQTKSMPERR